LSEQINTVLDYSQSEAGALPIARETVDLCALLTEVADSKAALANEHGVALDIQIDEAPASFSLDPKRIAQAVGQILDNAIRYHRTGGQVLLFARENDAVLEIVVSDNGPGIGATTNDPAEGVLQGLGLPLAKQLIESHNGTFVIESKAGEGTTVIMTLPR
jgi:signal transduction histidine kinase